jgi:4-hydroxy-tetrahydrodipicolinate synthase
MFQHLSGVYAAAVTPLNADFSIDLQAIPGLLDFLARRGCHGALLFGTTGEGPSFAPSERLVALEQAVAWRRTFPNFRLLFGSGTPSLEETIQLNKAAFETGADGVVTLPPYYFRKVTDDGLFAWFSQVIQRSVPPGKALFVYHFPSLSGVPISIDLLARLKDAFPDRLAGIKDSSGNPEHARQLGAHFGPDLLTLTGSDRLFSLALQEQASGCITAPANLISPALRQVWEAHLRGDPLERAAAQANLDAAREVLERYTPFPLAVKTILHRQYDFPHWTVRPPLLPLPVDQQVQLAAEYSALAGRAALDKNPR